MKKRCHFTISPFGSAGDVHPMLGLATKLRDRGHEIEFLTTGYFEDAVKQHGLKYVELGTKEEFLEAIRNPDLWSLTRSFPHVFEGIASVYRRHYEILEENHERHQTIAISSCLGFGARMAQEKFHLPLVTIHLQPAVVMSRIKPPQLGGFAFPRWFTNVSLWLGERLVIDRVAWPRLNPFREEIGLPPGRGLLSWWHSTQKNVCLFPDWFAAPQDDWPPHSEVTDFPLWDTDAELPSELDTFLQTHEPPIAFTPGSANIFGKEFFAAAVDACQRLNRPGLLLTRFAEQIPDNLPSNVRHVSYVPFATLLPRCAALVHHGGVGTTAQGLAAGIPQVIMALAHDQFDNGARVTRLGVGTWMNRWQFRGPKVARELDQLLRSDVVSRACASAAARLETRQGLDLAADQIETFASECVAES